MKLNTIRIAVIMTVHNRKETTLTSLYHLFRNHLTHEKIFVYMVDDGCIDGTSEAVAKIYPEVRIVQGSGELYWNRGMHLAWTEALKIGYDYYLWLNDDTFLFENAMELITNACQETSGNAIISGVTCSSSNNKVATYGGLVNSKLVFPNGHIQSIDQFWGNIVLVPRVVVEKIGILDPYFSHSMGDTEYSFRAKKHGIPMYVTSDFCGECDLHSDVPVWQNPQLPLRKRWKALHSPLGDPPREVFYLYSKYKGVLYATATIVMIYLTLLFPITFPKVWGLLKNKMKY